MYAPRAPVALVALLLALPVTAALAPLPPAACAPREGLMVPLADGGSTLVCVVEVPLLAPGARITVEGPGGPVEVPQDGMRILAGTVPTDPRSFVRLVEAPGYLAGVVQMSTGWHWIHPDGTVRFQGPVAIHTAYANPEAYLGDGPALVGRLQLWTDAPFLAAHGAEWHLYALTIINIVDGAFRGQQAVGLQVTGVQGWQGSSPGWPRQSDDFDLVQMLSGTPDGITPLGYASLGPGVLTGQQVGISWVRTSPALARPVPYYGGPYEGTLFGASVVSVHEIGHNLGHQHDPWYAGGQDGLPEPICTAYGGWRGEAQACMEILPHWKPLALVQGAEMVLRQDPLPIVTDP